MLVASVFIFWIVDVETLDERWETLDLFEGWNCGATSPRPGRKIERGGNSYIKLWTKRSETLELFKGSTSLLSLLKKGKFIPNISPYGEKQKQVFSLFS